MSCLVVMRVVVVGSLLGLAAHVGLGGLIGIGIVVGFGAWWPICVGVLVSVIVTMVWATDGDPARRAIHGARAVVFTIAAALFVGSVAVYLSDIGAVRAGERSLPGDDLDADGTYRDAASVSFLLSAAFIEEVAVRSGIQFRLQKVLGLAWAEVTAGLVFVALHALRFDTLGMVLFLAVSAFVTGRIARSTQAIIWPIGVHFLSNSVVLAVAFAFRP